MVFITTYLLIIVVGYPIWDYFYMKKVKKNLVSKQRMFGEIIISQWILVIIVVAFWITKKRSLSNLLFLDKPLFSFQPVILWAFGLGVGICIGMLALIFVFSKTVRKKFSYARTDENIQFLLPSTIGERLLFLLVAITAGVCEEIIFRGVMVYYLSHLPFELSIITMGIFSSLLFGIVHLYQGWKGVLLTTYLGAILFLLFVGTGNLSIPIILHIFIDAKFVFMPTKRVL
jgi:uncharacterized protein